MLRLVTRSKNENAIARPLAFHPSKRLALPCAPPFPFQGSLDLRKSELGKESWTDGSTVRLRPQAVIDSSEELGENAGVKAILGELALNVIVTFAVATIVVVLALDPPMPHKTMNDKDQAELEEWRTTFPEKTPHEVVGEQVLERAQIIAYREALEKILAATNDPWGWNKGSIAWICNEALGNGKP